MRDIGKNIKDLRIRRKMTQDELAEKLFVTRQTVSNYETGKSRPDIDMLMQIAEVLGADIHHLLYGTAQPAQKQDVRLLIIGSILTVLVGICFLALGPYAKELKQQHFLTGLNMFRGLCILPLFYLLLGWTLTHMLGMALKKPPLTSPWVKYIRWFLLFVVTTIFFIIFSWFIPELVGEYRMYHATGPRSSADYIHIPAYADFLFGHLFLSRTMMNLYPYSLAYPLPLGMLLWLFGFPAKKK